MESELNILFVLDNDSSFIVDDIASQTCFTEEEEFESELKSRNLPDVLVILAELDWSISGNNIFPGFEWANRLRREYRMLCPIVMTSTFQPEVFEELARKSPEKYNLLFGTGTSFMHIAKLYEKIRSNELEQYLKGRPNISEAVLEDMLEMLLQKGGFLIDKVTHDLKFSLDDKMLEEAIKNIGSYLSAGQKDTMKFTELSKAVIAASRGNSEQQFNASRDQLVAAIARNIPTTGHTKGDDDEKGQPLNERGEILIVEDDPRQLRVIKEQLAPCFAKVRTASEGTEAIKILQSDKNYDILAVIADWRLKVYGKDVTETEYWQEKQGYQVLEHAAKTHYASLISLTAEHDKNIHQIRNRLGISIQLFKKEHVSASGDASQWQMFTDIVKSKALESRNVICNLPNGAEWKKVCEQIEGKEERRLSDNSDIIKYQFQKSGDDGVDFLSVGTRFKVQKPDGSFRFYERIESYQEAYCRLLHSKKWGDFKADIEGKSEALWAYYSKAVMKPSLSLKSMGDLGFEYSKNLLNVLITRRVFFALLFALKDDGRYLNSIFDCADFVYDLMKKGEINLHAVDFGNRKGFLNQLCVKLHSIKILPEERSWLLEKDIYIDTSTSYVPEKAEKRTEEEPAILDSIEVDGPSEEELNQEAENVKSIVNDNLFDVYGDEDGF